MNRSVQSKEDDKLPEIDHKELVNKPKTPTYSKKAHDDLKSSSQEGSAAAAAANPEGVKSAQGDSKTEKLEEELIPEKIVKEWKVTDETFDERIVVVEKALNRLMAAEPSDLINNAGNYTHEVA